MMIMNKGMLCCIRVLSMEPKKSVDVEIEFETQNDVKVYIVFMLVLSKQLLRKLLIEFFNGRMVGKMKRYGNAKKKYFKDADHIISNNFETKLFHLTMDGHLRFPQVPTRSPLFYENPS